MIKIEQLERPINSITVLTYLAIAVKHLWLWSSPSPSDLSTILSLSWLVGFEFIMLHSGLFMMAFSGSKKAVIFFVVFYGLFAVAFNFAMPSNEILFLYMFVVISRMRVIFSKKNEKKVMEMFIYSAVRMGVYFVLIIPVSLIGKNISPLGLTRQFLADNNYSDIIQGSSGLFIENPQVALCFGFIYFSILTGLELKRLLKNPKFSKRQL